MATDKSEPRTGLIATLAVSSIITLVVIRAGLQSYFITMHEAEQLSKVNGVPAEQLDRLRTHERDALDRGAVRIEQAMSAVANGERPASITPRVSTDYASLQGWTQLPQVFHPPVVPSAAPAPPPAPSGTPAPGASASPSATPSAPPLLPEAQRTGEGGAQGASAAPAAASASAAGAH